MLFCEMVRILFHLYFYWTVGLRFSPVYDNFVSDVKNSRKMLAIGFLLEDVILKGS